MGGFVASPWEDLLDKAISYSAQKDADAFASLLASGKVIVLKGDQPVEVLEQKWGKTKVRLRGKSLELWTVSEAVRDE